MPRQTNVSLKRRAYATATGKQAARKGESQVLAAIESGAAVQKIRIGGRTITRRLQAPRDVVAGKVSLKIVTSRGKTYSQSWVHLPAQLTKHPHFPFENDEQVLIRIDHENRRLIVEKLLPREGY